MRLRRLREDAGLSEQDIADALAEHGHRFTRQSVNGWERGEHAPRQNAVVAIIEHVLDCEGELAELLGLPVGGGIQERLDAIEDEVRRQAQVLAEVLRRLDGGEA